jgi:hypothetical protein
MRSKAIILVITLVLLAGLVGISCSSGKKGTLADLIKQLPGDYDSIVFLDAANLRADADLKELYDGIAGSLLSGLEETSGLDISTVRSLALATESGTEAPIILLNGDFKLQELGKALQEHDFTADTYKETEVWKRVEEDMYMAFVDSNSIIISAETGVQRSLDVINGGAASLYDNKDFKDVSGRLPSGLMTVLSRDSWIIGQSEDNVPKLTGIALLKKDKSTMTMSGVVKFGNADAAKAALETVQTDLQDEGTFRNISATQDAEFAEFTADADISDIAF